MSFQVQDYPAVTFYGRERFHVVGDDHKKVLLGLGVFSEEGSNIFYSAAKKIIQSDGTNCWVDREGFVEYDDKKLAPIYYRDGVCMLDKDMDI